MTELNMQVARQEIDEGRRCPSCLQGWHYYPDGSGTLVHEDDCELVKAEDAEAEAANHVN